MTSVSRRQTEPEDHVAGGVYVHPVDGGGRSRRARYHHTVRVRPVSGRRGDTDPGVGRVPGGRPHPGGTVHRPGRQLAPGHRHTGTSSSHCAYSIFHQKMHLSWLHNANEIDTNYRKLRCPTQTQFLHTQPEPYSTGSHWGLCWIHRGSHWLHRGCRWVNEAFPYQHVDIGYANCSSWGPYPKRSPNANGCTFWWNIG